MFVIPLTENYERHGRQLYWGLDGRYPGAQPEATWLFRVKSRLHVLRSRVTQEAFRWHRSGRSKNNRHQKPARIFAWSNGCPEREVARCTDEIWMIVVCKKLRGSGPNLQGLHRRTQVR